MNFEHSKINSKSHFLKYIKNMKKILNIKILRYDLMDPRDAESHQSINSFILNAKKRHPSLTVEALR